MTAAAAAAGRLLSDLPDYLLLRILFLLPDRDAASAAMVSRRWRSLWRTSGAVYLDSRSIDRYIYQDKRRQLPPPCPPPPRIIWEPNNSYGQGLPRLPPPCHPPPRICWGPLCPPSPQVNWGPNNSHGQGLPRLPPPCLPPTWISWGPNSSYTQGVPRLPSPCPPPPQISWGPNNSISQGLPGLPSQYPPPPQISWGPNNSYGHGVPSLPPPCPSPPQISWGPNNFYSQGFSSKEDRLAAAVEKALASATAVPITRLTFVLKKPVEADDDANAGRRPDTPREEHDLLAAVVVSSPAARRVEELHVEVDDNEWKRGQLGLSSLPSEALRVLRLVNCCLLEAAAPPTFPRLAELDLCSCTASLAGLEGIVDAAPQLSTLHLESSYVSKTNEAAFHTLVCPAVTALVIADFSCLQRHDEDILGLEVPRLQSLRYKGAVQHTGRLSLKTPSDMIQVDLHLVDDHNGYSRQRVPVPILFWQFIGNFSSAKLLKLKLDFSMDCVAPKEAAENLDELVSGRDKLFRNVERLELDAQYRPGSEASIVALATLLHCCPVVRDLRLMLTKDMSWMSDFSIDQEARADFDKSLDRFRRRSSPMILLDEEDDDSYEAFDMPVLSNNSFSCLQGYLRRVSLHFCMDGPNCLGVQLAKFFAKEAMVLEEMYVDDGSQKMRGHMNVSVRSWMANSAKSRGLAENVAARSH